MHLICVGLNHNTAPVDIRESVFISERCLGTELNHLIKSDGVQEACLLSTCNRTEVYCVFDNEGENSDAPQNTLTAYFSSISRLSRPDISAHLYFHTDREAALHLMRVASGLDSMVLGEDQILAQVKSALAAAHAAGSVGSILNSLFQHSLAAGKRVRTETAINEGSFSIGSAAVELARSVFGQSLSGHKALVLGAGNMSELTAKHLQSHGVASVIVANRTFDRALSLAAALGDGAEAKLFDQLPVLLETSDIVICSTSAPHVVVSKTLLAEVMKKRANRPLFLIDIAAPRDVEPTAREIPEVYLFNIDDLKEVVAKSSEARLQETEKAQRIVDENAKQFLEWWSAAEAAPLVVAVRQKIDSIMLGETARLRTKMSGASEREFREVEKAMQSFAGKISHLATMAIRKSVALDPISGMQRLEGIRSAFGFDETQRDKRQDE